MSVRIADLAEPGGVVGEDRHGDQLVSLDDGCLPVVDAVGSSAWHLFRAVTGRTHPAGEAIYQRVTHPRSGDLVVVRDSIAHRDPDTRRRGLGYLLLVRAEYANHALRVGTRPAGVAVPDRS